jgi:hypothetical protein
MYLATLHVSLDLEPEVASEGREKVLRALRDRLKQAFGSRITVRTDDDAAIVIAFLDDNYERAQSRIKESLDRIEGASEARVFHSHSQVFMWFDGKFQETREELEQFHDNPLSPSNAGRTKMNGGNANGKTIRYASEDEDDDFSPIPSRLSRKSLRIPTRK